MKKGQLFLNFFFFIVSALIIIVTAAVFSPAAEQMTEKFYEIGDDLLSDANISASTLTDTQFRDSMTADLSEALLSTNTNKLVIKNFSAWIWVLVLIIAAVSVYLLTESQTTTRPRGFI